MKNITLVILLILSTVLYGQDVHFTNYLNIPTLLNPGLTGGFKGNIRAGSNYRNQWGSTGTSYNTIAFGVDGRYQESRNTSYLGYGLNVFRDIAGAVRLTTQSINATLSGGVNLDKDNSIAVGISAGILQKNLDANNGEWDSQFDGNTYDPSLPSNEDFNVLSASNFDLSVGLIYTFGEKKMIKGNNSDPFCQLGLSVQHLVKPSTELFVKGESIEKSLFNLHGEMNFPIYQRNFTVKPRFNLALQGTAYNLNVGSIFSWFLKSNGVSASNNANSAINIGFNYRLLDAFSPIASIQIGSVKFGMSYDINLSALSTSTSGRGGTEIFIVFQNTNQRNNR